jgi:protein-tyrosine phosphatase
VIDTHCHLLPGLDDGPSTEGDAVALAEDLVRDGIVFVLCTPHFSRLFPTRQTKVLERRESLTDALAAAGVPLGISAAAEVSAALVLSEPIDELKQRSVHDRYLMVELHPDTPGTALSVCRDRLAEAGLQAVFAHPERCRAVQREPSLLDEPRARGSLMQIVAPSLLGRWGTDVAESAWGLLRSERIDLMGSDAHGGAARRCHLLEAAELIERSFGGDVRRDLTERRPAALVGVDLPPGISPTSALAEPVE